MESTRVEWTYLRVCGNYSIETEWLVGVRGFLL